MNPTYTVEFKTLDGNFHKETVTAANHQHAREVFWCNQRGKLRHSRISYIVSVHR